MLQSDYSIQAIRQLRSRMGAKIILRIRKKCLCKAASHKRQMKSCSRKIILTFWENHIVPVYHTFDVTGTGDEAEYTLSGILNEDRKSEGYFVYLSKDIAMSLRDHLQVTAYTRLNTEQFDLIPSLTLRIKSLKTLAL